MPARSDRLDPSTLLGLAVLALAWRLGHGVAGLAYAAAYVLATLPGWPLGWRLFGRRHAGGWIAGALLGYALSAWTIWASTSLGFTASWQRIAAWAVVTAIAWGTLVRAGSCRSSRCRRGPRATPSRSRWCWRWCRSSSRGRSRASASGTPRARATTAPTSPPTSSGTSP